MFYSAPLYTKQEISTVKPMISKLNEFYFVDVFKAKWDDWNNNITIVKYDELFAWNHFENYGGRYHFLKRGI